MKTRQNEARREFKTTFAKWQADHSAWQRAATEAKKAGEEPPGEPQQPTMPRHYIDDATIEAVGAILAENDRGVLVAREELSTWFGSFDAYRSGRGADGEKWACLHGGRDLTIDRRTGTPKTLHVCYAAASITGTIQPGTLRRHLKAEHRDSGLASRLLFAAPPQRQSRWTDAEVDDATEEALADLFAKLYLLDLDTDRHGERRPGLIPLSPDAKTLWVAFYNEHGRDQYQLAEGDLQAVWSKAEGYAARFALLFAMVRRATGEIGGPTEDIDPQSMADGIALARWFAAEAERVYQLIDADDAERTRIELVEWIRRRGGTIAVRDLQKNNARYREPRTADKALRDLATRGFGRMSVEPAGPKGGRPSDTFTLTD